jgi:hypothetical protein
MGLLGMVEAIIEDLAITIRSSRESDGVRRRGCIEHDFTKGSEIRTILGTEAKVAEMGVNGRSSAAAEKSGEGMALKIFMGAKPFLKAYIKPLDITEIEMLPNVSSCFLNDICTKI